MERQKERVSTNEYLDQMLQNICKDLNTEIRAGCLGLWNIFLLDSNSQGGRGIFTPH